MLLVATALLVPLARLLVPSRPDPVRDDHPDAARLRADLAAIRAQGIGEASTGVDDRRGRPVDGSTTGLVDASGSGS